MNNRFFKIFFYLLPFVDLITALITRNLGVMFTPGIIIKFIFLLINIFIIFWGNSKYKKFSICTVLFILLYSALYLFFKEGIFKIEYLKTELVFLFKLIYFPIVFLGMLNYFDNQGFDKKQFLDLIKYTLVVYIILLVISTIFNVSYSTYPAYLKGNIGWFYAGNEISNIMVLLFPISFIFFDKSKYSFLIIFPIILIALMIGTKVATFGLLIDVFIVFIYLFLRDKFKFNKKILLVILYFLLLIPNSYAVYNYKYMYENNIYGEEDNLVIDEDNIQEVNQILDELEVFYNKNEFNKIISTLLNGRDKLLANTISIYNDSDDIGTILFGIGFSNTDKVNNSNIGRLIEIDICDGFFHFGLIGLFIMFLPIIITVYFILKNISKFNINALFYGLIILLVLGVSTFSGHVFLAPAVSIYFVLYLLLLLNEFEVISLKRKLDKKISLLSLHLGVGGVEKSVVSQANMLCENNEVEIVCLYKNSKIYYEIDKKVKVIYLSNLYPNRDEFKDALKKKNPFKIICEGIKAIYILFMKWYLISKYIYNSNSEVIISSRYYFTKLLNRYGYKDTIKVAEEHVYHNNDIKYINKLRRSLTNIDYLIPASNYLKDDYKEIFKFENVKVVYLPQVIDYLPSKKKISGKNVIVVGRLEREKGLFDLIDIIKKVNDLDKSITFTICGDGSLRNDLVNYVKELGLSKCVKFKGNLSSIQLRKEYEKSSLFLMTSYEESFGLVLLEAMSYGLTCFAFDSALGAKEIIVKGSGKLIKDRNIDSMAQEIVDYYSKKVSFNDFSYKRAKEYFINNAKDKWLDFFGSVSKARVRKRVIFISSTGGHLNELMMLKDSMLKCNSYVITEKDDASSYVKEEFKGRCNYLKATTRYQLSYLVWSMYNLILSLYYFIKINPDVIVSTGSHTAVPMCYIAKIFHRKVIYIESFANMASKSLAGKLVYPIADVFIVQWESMLKLYPKAIYGGWLF